MILPIPIIPLGIPFSPLDMEPPTLYSVMNSIANYSLSGNNEEVVKNRDLATKTHSTIFNGTYPLSSKVNKVDFEVMILNHFINRRIGFQTVEMFRIRLINTLQSIMPRYNKLFDVLEDWNIFKDGEDFIKTTNANLTTNNTGSTSTESTSTSDNRYSSTPQNQIDDIKNGSYVSEYTYIQNNDNTDTSVTSDSTQHNNVVEASSRSQADKIKNYIDFQNNVNSIMNMIYNELEPLFFGIV